MTAMEKYQENFGARWAELQEQASIAGGNWATGWRVASYWNDEEAWEQAWEIASEILEQDGVDEDDPTRDDLVDKLSQTVLEGMQRICGMD